MKGNPQIALTLLRTFVKRIYDQRRRFMILKLNDVQARVADVFLMLFEGMNTDPDQTSCEFSVTSNDVAHWAGLGPDQVRTVINQLANQRRIEVYPNKIVVTNIHDLPAAGQQSSTGRRVGAPSPMPDRLLARTYRLTRRLRAGARVRSVQTNDGRVWPVYHTRSTPHTRSISVFLWFSFTGSGTTAARGCRSCRHWVWHGKWHPPIFRGSGAIPWEPRSRRHRDGTVP